MRTLHLLLLCLLFCGCSRAQEPTSGLLLKQVTIAGRPEATGILINGSRIADIDAGLQQASQVLDCSGLTVVPGFIDTHVHLGLLDPSEVLAGGLTTVRDLGWRPGTSYGWVGASGSPTWGPKVLVAGPMLTAPGGYPLRAGWAPSGTGVVYERGMLEKLRDSGSSVVKVTLEPGAGPTMEAERLAQLVDEAGKLGLQVVAHVSTVPELRKALAAGVQQYAHFVFDNSEVPPEIIEQMVGQETVVIPTLRVHPAPSRLSNLQRYRAAGGRVVYGTDLGNGGRPGIDIVELKLMQEAGMKPADILDSATREAADLLGLPDRGRLEKNAVADLVVVRGDPLKDWEVLANPMVVIREGVVVVNRLAP